MDVRSELINEIGYFFGLYCDGNGNINDENGIPLVDEKNSRKIIHGEDNGTYYLESKLSLMFLIRCKAFTHRAYKEQAVDLISLYTYSRHLISNVTRTDFTLQWPDFPLSYVSEQQYTYSKDNGTSEIHEIDFFTDYIVFDCGLQNKNRKISMCDRDKWNNRIPILSMTYNRHPHPDGSHFSFKFNFKKTNNGDTFGQEFTMSVKNDTGKRVPYVCYDVDRHIQNNNPYLSPNIFLWDSLELETVITNTNPYNVTREDGPTFSIAKYDQMCEVDPLYIPEEIQMLRRNGYRSLLSNTPLKKEIKEYLGWKLSDYEFEVYLREIIDNPIRITNITLLDMYISFWCCLFGTFCDETHEIQRFVEIKEIDDIKFKSYSILIKKPKTRYSIEKKVKWNGCFAQKIKFTKNLPWMAHGDVSANKISSLFDLSLALVPQHKQIPEELREAINDRTARNKVKL